MYEMKPEYYIGIDMIDEEHKQLFKYADEAYELLHDEFTPDKYDRMDIILEKLRDYTVKHFADEEQYMESIHYKKMFTQKVQHMEFVQKLDEFIEHHSDEEIDQDEQIMGILKYLTDWLINHILYVDCQIPSHNKDRVSGSKHVGRPGSAICHEAQNTAGGWEARHGRRRRRQAA